MEKQTMNKSFLKALEICGLENPQVDYEKKLYMSNDGTFYNITKDSVFANMYGVGELTGHMTRFVADKIGAKGNLAKKFMGTAYISDVANSDPGFGIELDGYEENGRCHEIYVNYTGTLQKGLVAIG